MLDAATRGKLRQWQKRAVAEYEQIEKAFVALRRHPALGMFF